MSSADLSDSYLPEKVIESLAWGFSGEIIRPDEPGYDQARRVWNGMIDRRPALIVRPRHAQDVAAGVVFARDNGLLLAVRGGGHNVAGLGTCDGGLVIDLSMMRSVNIDTQRRLARVQGGATWGEVDAVTQQHGLAAPGGLISETGVAGLTLGGGYGWLRNRYGLSCDNLVSAEVVLADGRIVRAAPDENTDLLWALRGGGGNFGVVTSFEFNLHPVGPEVEFVFVFHDGKHSVEGLQFYHDYCRAAPEDVSTLAFLGMFPPGSEAFPAALHGQTFLAFGAMYAGQPQDGERILSPLRNFQSPLVDFSGRMPYTQAQKIFDEDYPAYRMRYYWKSLNLLRMNDEVIRVLVDHAGRQPSPFSTVDVWHVGGAVKKPHPDSAFSGRHAAYLVNPEANWEDPRDDAANITWVRELIEALAPYSDGSRYLNFAGFQEEGERMMAESFGENYRRLAAVKHEYDPGNLFRLNQNILPGAKTTKSGDPGHLSG